jgi:hypothetical protein
MKRTRKKWTHSEITYINELALTVGLIMLTIGNFLEANGLTKVGDVGDGIKRNFIN